MNQRLIHSIIYINSLEFIRSFIEIQTSRKCYLAHANKIQQVGVFNAQRTGYIDFLEKSVSTIDHALSNYLIAITIIVAVNILTNSSFILAAAYPLSLSIAFVVAPAYVLLLPFYFVIRLTKTRRKFFLLHKRILLKKTNSENLKEAASYVDKIQRAWSYAVIALFAYFVLSLLLLYLQMWMLW